MKRLIIVNGYPRSGKDSFMDFFVNRSLQNGFLAVKHSTIDTVKEAAKVLTWNGEKTPAMRCFLSEMKDLYTKYFDGPAKEIQNLLLGTPNNFVLAAVREPSEIQKLVHWCDWVYIECFTILVTGKYSENYHLSHSDSNVLDYPYMIEIKNTGELIDLEKAANAVFSHLSGSAIDYDSLEIGLNQHWNIAA